MGFPLLLFILRRLLRSVPLRLPRGRNARIRDLEERIDELESKVLALDKEVQVLHRRNPRPRIRRWEKVLLAALSKELPRSDWHVFIFQPATILRWHREIVARKWTFRQNRIGRPPIDPKLRELIVRMAKNSSDWGCYRVKGELQSLGYRVGVSTIRGVLREAGVPPAPRRDGPTWSELLRAQADAILACDFFSVETVFLRTLYVLVFIEIGSRRLRFSVATDAPDTSFVTQAARNLYIGEELAQIRFLIRDRDSKYARSFDDVFRCQGVRVVKTPIRAPDANAFAERVIGTVKRGVTDLLLILGERHLNLILRRFVEHYNSHRPHMGIDLQAPDTIGETPSPVPFDEIRSRRVVGGLIREYYAEAA